MIEWGKWRRKRCPSRITYWYWLEWTVLPFAEIGNMREEGEVNSLVQFCTWQIWGVWETSKCRCLVNGWVYGFPRIHSNLHFIALLFYPSLLNPRLGLRLFITGQHLKQLINSFSLIHFLLLASRFLSWFSSYFTDYLLLYLLPLTIGILSRAQSLHIFFSTYIHLLALTSKVSWLSYMLEIAYLHLKIGSLS